ncbi:DNA-binding transcriptional LysR family regulator [Sphingobium sp. B2D3A]|uniref:LysR family transcriptional regulator n=1 Tax=Sphingobium TaxID=165695 RepID=UPI0015EC95B4|nr:MULTISPECIES: LysR family transcriptional regulator [Sphingobium]MCW2336082.1 DNA-binding transcriptional LysR family regulator [Sphingobium sp. B2D3A]MCW2351683.1 DNA-binding transcriptional LysR family regulator [Sphingobium sp. B12D2B]MCW2363808.1 DNA-binding transcriptional LysR family regulator [Sphingobium sp. B10D3B]MCW2370950.1 DNA-binding transcriptional LysR family regulator [Sphingobium sp. B11D3D]MCW2380498.1 DNA-binding transcriptional LysR family regulator [Sphingobium sp. B2D
MALRNQRIWQYIDEVARVGSVRQAAERLNVTPSALLRRIQDVEHDLNAVIFERHTSGVRLTAAGEVLISWIRMQTSELRRVYSQIEELEGLQRGEVRIACSQAVARSFVLRHIVSFREKHPNVKFKLSVTDHSTAVRALIDYEMDIVLIFRPLRSSELHPIMSIGQGLVAVMAADHPLAQHEVLRLRQCAEYDVAMPDMAFGGREIVENRLLSSSAKLNVAVEANSFDFLGELVAGGDLITFQIDIGADVWRHDPRFAVRRISDIDRTYGPLVLGQLKGRPLPLVAAKFAEQMARDLHECRSLPTLPGAAEWSMDEDDDDAAHGFTLDA